MADGGMRSEVVWFAQEMERKLQENDYKSHWSGCSPKWLLNRLRQETSELERAIAKGDAKDIAREAADVGNFAMMIADVCRRDDEGKANS
jgi:NTP pyrophosphatase (non-canonical NTP hydrolase)